MIEATPIIHNICPPEPATITFHPIGTQPAVPHVTQAVSKSGRVAGWALLPWHTGSARGLGAKCQHTTWTSSKGSSVPHWVDKRAPITCCNRSTNPTKQKHTRKESLAVAEVLRGAPSLYRNLPIYQHYVARKFDNVQGSVLSRCATASQRFAISPTQPATQQQPPSCTA
jgi:hypothetical protein